MLKLYFHKSSISKILNKLCTAVYCATVSVQFNMIRHWKCKMPSHFDIKTVAAKLELKSICFNLNFYLANRVNRLKNLGILPFDSKYIQYNHIPGTHLSVIIENILMVKNICEMVYWSQIDTKYIRLCRILNCFYKKDRFLFYVDIY